jgi:peptidoglycan hydrolase-like protein with peptidoglycan-binding domain
MNKRFWVIFLAVLTVLPLLVVGCKGNTEKAVETPVETPETLSTTLSPTEEPMAAKEPAQSVATETIPPTAAPPAVEKPPAVPQETHNRNKDIQAALKNAGYYTGAIDGKIGPKTKKAIEEFQRAKELKVDGKVGPKTWAELEKYLSQ